MLVVVDSDAILFEFGEAYFLTASGAIGTCSILSLGVYFRRLTKDIIGRQKTAKLAVDGTLHRRIGRQIRLHFSL